MNHLFRAALATAVACTALFAVLNITDSDETPTSSSAPTQDGHLYLPMIAGSTNPAGAYFCYEWEFGLIWMEEVITLSVDGSSAYDLPYGGVVTGTWVYTPSSEEVGFTNFHWLTATFQPPNRLWASKYLTYTGFEIAISCNRLQ
jgi:hypothetical protein